MVVDDDDPAAGLDHGRHDRCCAIEEWPTTKRGAPPPAASGWRRSTEGLCVQTMHIGSYDAEGPSAG
jgi:hypothetical protein